MTTPAEPVVVDLVSDSDVEEIELIDLTAEDPPPPRKRPRDEVGSAGTPIYDNPRKKAAAPLPAAESDEDLKVRAQDAYNAQYYARACEAFVELSRRHEAAGDAEKAGHELGNAAACTLMQAYKGGREEQDHAHATETYCVKALALAKHNPTILLRRAKARLILGKTILGQDDARRALAAAEGRAEYRKSFRDDCAAILRERSGPRGAAPRPRVARHRVSRPAGPAWDDVRLRRVNGSRHCRALGLSVARASDRVDGAAAKAEYKKLALELHPDKLRQRGVTDAGAVEAAAARFRAAKDAYEVFGDADKLARFHFCYDVLGTTLPFPDQHDEVLDYDSEDDTHKVRDRSAWTTSKRRVDGPRGARR